MSVMIGPYPNRYTEGKWTGLTVLQVHATAESAGWKEARVELGYASRGPDPAGTSGVEEAPGAPP